ncbi:MAG: GAF domain-containing protein [Anaeromyxobacteraceae bacterium]
MKPKLSDLFDAFQGVVPSIIATAGADGTPNVTYNSQVYFVDENHVALSCQFFNKTHRNVRENPAATVEVYEPVTLQAWRLRLHFDHMETEGPLFDAMALRIQVIASHTGMSGVFKLRSADVYEVLSLEPVEGMFLPIDPGAPVALPLGPLTELRGLQLVSDRINRATDLEGLLAGALESLDETFGFSHAMVLVPEEADAGHLVALATRGYGAAGVGAEVRLGEGIIGLCAERRKIIRLGGMGGELRYGRALRARAATEGGKLAPEVPLPGLDRPQAQLAIPLQVGGRLLGVLALESEDPLRFDDWDEPYLTVVANQNRARHGPDDGPGGGPGPPARARPPRRGEAHPAPRREDPALPLLPERRLRLRGRRVPRPERPGEDPLEGARRARARRPARVHEPRAAPRSVAGAAGPEGQPRVPADPPAQAARGEVPRREARARPPRPLRPPALRRRGAGGGGDRVVAASRSRYFAGIAAGGIGSCTAFFTAGIDWR